MNQIIYNSNSNLETLSNNYKNIYKKKSFFKVLFFILVIISFLLIVYYSLYKYDLYASEKLSKVLLDNYSITGLYPNNNYTATRTNIKSNLSELSSSVIGIIEIKKINILYPILSDISKKNLKISPCKFYGPPPNTPGNLCIAAHNYKNETFFSNISKLVNGDIITIYDTNENYIDYIVYKVYTTFEADTECINQDTFNLKVITLITCDSLNNKFRTIVKAKEI